MNVFSISSDELQLELCPIGARLQTVRFDGSANLVDSASDEDELRGQKKYNGAVVGPVANRIAGASASLDGKTYHFEANENGKTCLHAGATGVHLQTWEAEQKQLGITFTLALSDGFGGFPGNRRLEARYCVAGSAFSVEFLATTDAPTWVNLALHPYWSLAVGRSALDLAVKAEQYTPVDADKIPLGHLDPVDGSKFDLRELGTPSAEIDHNFDIRDQTEPQVTLSSRDIRLDIETDAPGVQVYSGKEIGIAIEPQHWPDAMHHPTFPTVELRPGETYRQFSTYRFTRV